VKAYKESDVSGRFAYSQINRSNSPDFSLRDDMAKLLFKLQGVPEDEIQQVRELCESLELDIYETEAGRWQIGIAAIWLKDDSQYSLAREALDEYHAQRYQDAQQDRQQVEQLSLVQGLYVKFKQDPQGFSLSLIAISIVIGFSLYPFLNL
jgi:hypothetical protein